MKQRGKSLGFYHYAGGGNATREADYFVNTVRPYVGEAVLVLDWESYQNAAWGNSNWIRVFVNRVHDRTGVWPLVYVSAAFIPQIPADVRANCGLWVAQYANNNPTGWQSRPWNYGKYGEAMRQYTSNGRINGYNGPLDLNYFRGTREQWDKYANPGKISKPAPTPAPQPAPSVDYEALATATIRGDYGNGESRRAALGANYGPVMRIVNQRLNGFAVYAPAASTRSVSVTVRRGDTMPGIAKRTGLWPLSAWSVPSGNISLIYPGNIVTYRDAVTSASSGSTTTGGHVYVVKSGETLSGIFGANGWQRVAQLNNLSNPNLIYPGQRLRYWPQPSWPSAPCRRPPSSSNQGEDYGYFHRDHTRIRARGLDRARIRAGVQEIHPQQIRRTYVPRSVHPVRHHRHRRHRRIRRHLHVGGYRARRRGGRRADRVYACQPSF